MEVNGYLFKLLCAYCHHTIIMKILCECHWVSRLTWRPFSIRCSLVCQVTSQHQVCCRKRDGHGLTGVPGGHSASYMLTGGDKVTSQCRLAEVLAYIQETAQFLSLPSVNSITGSILAALFLQCILATQKKSVSFCAFAPAFYCRLWYSEGSKWYHLHCKYSCWTPWPSGWRHYDPLEYL